MHAHHYVQYGLSSSPTFEIKLPDRSDFQQVKSFIIPSDVSHKLRLTGEDDVLMVWLDPEFRIKQSITSSDEIQTSLGELEKELEPFYKQSLDCDLARQIREIFTGRPVSGREDRLDDRISSSIIWIKEHLSEQTITTEQLAETVYLSPSRFMHLFSDQIGIPVRKYILWQRLRHALLQLADGISITQTAHKAGFTDSPHMNRTFNAMFGITPSRIFKNSRFIQVFGC